MSRKFSNLEVNKLLTTKLKAMGKGTKIPSEIRDFFSEKRRASVMEAITRLIESLSVDNKSLGGDKRFVVYRHSLNGLGKGSCAFFCTKWGTNFVGRQKIVTFVKIWNEWQRNYRSN